MDPPDRGYSNFVGAMLALHLLANSCPRFGDLPVTAVGASTLLKRIGRAHRHQNVAGRPTVLVLDNGGYPKTNKKFGTNNLFEETLGYQDSNLE